ncbi:VOC family protein [Cryptosporangium arvum]|uniref:VOC family protein n=1 Tax=Cryptosporangium arvum TaxID=80871 RepID=UPI0004B3B5B9|nr:VOC family protein [Cryptosporangium arvum]
MAIARFKDLVLDAPPDDAAGLSRFWAAVLGSTTTEGPKGYRVDARPGAPIETQLWVNPVPEPRTGKTRVHLDLRLPEPDVSPLVALGARIVSEPGVDPWWQLIDPDGNIFCAFLPSATPVAGPTPFELNVDCADALGLATWWADRLGGEVHQAEHKDYTWIEGAAGFPWDMWVFGPVPEPKSVKNRWHWDVTLVDADGPEPFVEAGATLHRSPDDDISWWVLGDPEGNEFCLFPRESR